MKSIFIDSVLDIAVTGQIVRMECGVIQANRDADGENTERKLKMVPSYQVVMPLETFVRSIEVQQKIVDQLKEKGVLKPREEAPAAEAEKVDAEKAEDNKDGKK